MVFCKDVWVYTIEMLSKENILGGITISLRVLRDNIIKLVFVRGYHNTVRQYISDIVAWIIDKQRKYFVHNKERQIC